MTLTQRLILLGALGLPVLVPAMMADLDAEQTKRFDANKDGVLNEEERAFAFRTLREENAQKLREAEFMKRFDTDKDGVISIAEREAAGEILRKESELPPTGPRHRPIQ